MTEQSQPTQENPKTIVDIHIPEIPTSYIGSTQKLTKKNKKLLLKKNKLKKKSSEF